MSPRMAHILVYLSVLTLVTALTGHDAEARKRRRRGKSGKVVVSCNLPDAEVFIDGKSVGTADRREFAAVPGTRVVVVKKLGFLEVKEKVRVASGKRVEVVADLLPFVGVLDLKSAVAGASVFVDGKRVGTAPLIRELPLGSRTIMVKARGREPWTRTIVSAAGSVHQLEAFSEGEVGGDELGLELAPLAGGEDPELDGLSLEGLVPGGGPGDGDELSLEALPGSPEDPLALAPLGPDGTKLDLSRSPSKPTPWYLRWYTIAGGALALVAAVAIPTAIAASGGGCPGTTATPDNCRDVFGSSQPCQQICLPGTP